MCSPTLLLLSCQQSGYCPRDSESLALLIEWVLVWNTHTRTHAETYIHPRTHTLVTLLQMEGGRGMSVRPRVMGEHQSLPVSLAFFFFFLSAPTPRLSTSSHFSSASLISLCFEWWCVCVCVCACVCGECSRTTWTRRRSVSQVLPFSARQLSLVSFALVPPGHDKPDAF